MRIGIVNDLTIAAEALRRIVTSVPEHQVVWIARNGREAIANCARDRPDLILMDLIMPVMDGVAATRQIMKDTPCGILVVTATIDGNATKVFEAMSAGALDAVNTPSVGVGAPTESTTILLRKIAMLGRFVRGHQKTAAPPTSTAAPAAGAKSSTARSAVPPLVAIGSSTGGPKALVDILSALPADFGAAVAIIQHVDVQFSAELARWLNEQTPLTVRIAEPGDTFTRGVALLAASNDHLVLNRGLTLSYTTDPIANPYRPSVDAFFRSAARHWPDKATAVLLTGMGHDGAEGLLALHALGWHTIAQDEATCVVYSMPKAAVQLGAADQVLPISNIAPAILRQLQRPTAAVRR